MKFNELNYLGTRYKIGMEVRSKISPKNIGTIIKFYKEKLSIIVKYKDFPGEVSYNPSTLEIIE